MRRRRRQRDKATEVKQTTKTKNDKTTEIKRTTTEIKRSTTKISYKQKAKLTKHSSFHVYRDMQCNLQWP